MLLHHASAGILVAALLLITVAPSNGCRVLSIVTGVGNWTPTTGPANLIGKPKPTGYWLSEFTVSLALHNTSSNSPSMAANYFQVQNCSKELMPPDHPRFHSSIRGLCSTTQVARSPLPHQMVDRAP